MSLNRMSRVTAALVILFTLVLGAPADAADDPILCGRYSRAATVATDPVRMRELLANPLAAQCTETRDNLRARLNATAPAPSPARPVERPPSSPVMADEIAWRNAQAAGSCEAYNGFLSLFRTSRFAPEARRQIEARCSANAPQPPAGVRQAPKQNTAPQIVTTPSRATFEPEMVRLSGGSFVMGSAASEAGRERNEGPQRTVRVRPFEVGKYEVTFAEWDACVANGGCRGVLPKDEGWGRQRQPVIGVSWEDAKAYVEWLSQRAGRPYRLPTEAEWEYAARAGTTGPYSNNGTVSQLCAIANFGDASLGGLIGSTECKDGFRERTAPVGHFAPNAFGLHDMHGNASEWVEDCYFRTLPGDNLDGSPNVVAGCPHRVVRGGSWHDDAPILRSAARYGYAPILRNPRFGFRVARSIQ